MKIKKIKPKNVLQYLFFGIYFLMLTGLVYSSSEISSASSQLVSNHPMQKMLEINSVPGHEPWRESFYIGQREIFPLYTRAKNNETEVSGFAYAVPDGNSRSPVRLMLFVDKEGKVIAVVPVKISAPFGFSEEFIQQSVFFDSFKGAKEEQILPFEEGGIIPKVTGAASLSQQVIYAVREGVAFFAAHRDAMRRAVEPAPRFDDNVIKLSYETQPQEDPFEPIED